MAATAGFVYDFSIYSGALKAQFQLTQSSLAWVGTAGVFFFWTSPIGGYMADKYGPRVTNITGGLIMTTGLTLSFLFARGYLPSLPQDPASATFILSACSCLTRIGANSVSAVAFSLPVKLYPNLRGYVTGLVKSLTGLSGGLLAQLFTLLLGPPGNTSSTLGFLLFLALVAFVINVLLAPLLLPTGTKMRASLVGARTRETGGREDIEVRAKVKASCIIVIVLIAAVLSCSFLTAAGTVPASTNSSVPMAATSAVVASKSVGAYFLAALLMLLVVGMHFPLLFGKSTTTALSEVEDPTRILLLPLVGEAETTSDEAETTSDEVDNAIVTATVDTPTLVMLRRTNFWLLLGVGQILVGGGYFLTTNSFQIVESSGIHGASAGTAITVFSAVQGLSRMVSGVMPDMLGKTGAAHRRLQGLCVYALSMGVGHALLWLAPLMKSLVLLYAGYLACGIGFGGVWPVMVCVAADIWGLQNLGANYMVFDATTAFVGALVLGKILPQSVYAAHVVEGAHTCNGPGCFGLAHVVECACCAVGVLFSMVLLRRRRPR